MQETRQEGGQGTGSAQQTEQESTGMENAQGPSAEDDIGSGKLTAQMQRISEEWKETAECVALSANSFSKGQGRMPGSMRWAESKTESVM